MGIGVLGIGVQSFCVVGYRVLDFCLLELRVPGFRFPGLRCCTGVLRPPEPLSRLAQAPSALRVQRRMLRAACGREGRRDDRLGEASARGISCGAGEGAAASVSAARADAWPSPPNSDSRPSSAANAATSAAFASSEVICSAPASMTATCESIRSQIRPSLPISRRRQAISRSTRAPLRTGARRASSARLSSASAADCWAASTAPRMAASASFRLFLRGGRSGFGVCGLLLVRRQAFLKQVVLAVEVCFLLKALLLLRGEALARSAPPRRAPCGCRRCGCAWRIRSGTSGRATSP